MSAERPEPGPFSAAPSSAPAPTGRVALETDAFGRLVLTSPDGERFVGVVPVRCFPYREPNGLVSFLDEKGREVFCVESWEGLDPALARRLAQEFERRELLPTITRVRSVSDTAEPTLWQVDTDRGPVGFTLPSEDNIRRLGEHGALIADVHGVRYRIVDLRALDAFSRKLLNRYL